VSKDGYSVTTRDNLANPRRSGCGEAVNALWCTYQGSGLRGEADRLRLRVLQELAEAVEPLNGDAGAKAMQSRTTGAVFVGETSSNAIRTGIG
jgi:hypothetical protein